MAAAAYPVHVDASLDGRLSRWLWLVKWFLALPHYLVLAFLWPAFVVLSAVAFVAILVTGRYPRAIFEFNVGVLRWSWRVASYAYGTLGTDRYPPFTLAEVPDYPAHLSVEYPARLSRGLVLVKWWLLALPHYIVVALFLGGSFYVTTEAAGSGGWRVGSPGLIGLVVLVAAIVLLFTGTYPKALFDVVLGMNRWVLRVAAYAALMTDDYPPFRFDTGGTDPGTTTSVAPPGTAVPDAGSAGASIATPHVNVPTVTPGKEPFSWTTGRVVAAGAGAVLLLTALGLLGGGAVLGLADRTMRDDAGFLMTPEQAVGTGAYALVTEPLTLETGGTGDAVPDAILGEITIRVNGGTEPVFVGVARTSDVHAYLAGVEHSTLTGFDEVQGESTPLYSQTPGEAPSTLPASAGIWAASTVGAGAQSLTWDLEDGEWTVVLMNADGGRDVTADVRVGATAPLLQWLVLGLLLGGTLLLVLAIALMVVALHRRPSSPTAPSGTNPERGTES